MSGLRPSPGRALPVSLPGVPRGQPLSEMHVGLGESRVPPRCWGSGAFCVSWMDTEPGAYGSQPSSVFRPPPEPLGPHGLSATIASCLSTGPTNWGVTAPRSSFPDPQPQYLPGHGEMRTALAWPQFPFCASPSLLPGHWVGAVPPDSFPMGTPRVWAAMIYRVVQASVHQLSPDREPPPIPKGHPLCDGRPDRGCWPTSPCART